MSGLGLYAGAADQSPSQVSREVGLHGLVASQVSDTASGRARWIVFLVMIPAVLYALAKLYRAVAIVHALAWRRSGRGAGLTAAGIGLLGAALVFDLGAAAVVGWIRRQDQFGGLAALAVYLVLVGGTWLLVSRRLPGGEAGWLALLPGALVVGTGFLFVNVFNVYVTTRLVENRANTYGVLGVATALLFSLVLVGRVVVIAAELNASIDAASSHARRKHCRGCLIRVPPTLGAAHLEEVLEHVNVPSYHIDPTGVVRWLNAAARSVVGDVRGSQFTSVVAPEDTRRARELFARKVIGAVTVTDAAVQVVAADGERVAVEISSVPVYRGDHLVGVFGQVSDLIEEPHAHAELQLTPRQSEVLALLEQGRTTKQIAEELHLSTETVRNHVKRLLLTMGAHSRLEAVAIAHEAA